MIIQLKKKRKIILIVMIVLSAVLSSIISASADASGVVGIHEWEISNGTLTINGVDTMWNFHASGEKSAPWLLSGEKITKVVIGEGKGQNWWCVMFPPMCLPTATAECEISEVLTDVETEIVTESEKYKIRFKIVEFLEEIFN